MHAVYVFVARVALRLAVAHTGPSFADPGVLQAARPKAQATCCRIINPDAASLRMPPPTKKTLTESNLVVHSAEDWTPHALATNKLVSGVWAHRHYRYPVHADCNPKEHAIQSRYCSLQENSEASPSVLAPISYAAAQALLLLTWGQGRTLETRIFGLNGQARVGG